MKRILLAIMLCSCTSGDRLSVDGECVFDADCDEGQACEASACTWTCVGDSDCSPGQVCGPGVNTVSRICGPPRTTAADNVPAPQTPESGTPFEALVIESTTMGAACDGNEPGPDVFGVAVEGDGSTLAWGQVEFASVAIDGNAHANSSVLNGQAPNIDTMTGCPEMFDGSVVSLGCEGAHVVVSFADADGEDFAVDPSQHHIRVFEWGGQCDTAAVEDTYDARLCRIADDAFIGDLSSCSEVVIRNGTGEQQAGPPDPI